jgi:hypothetical protein
MAKVAAIEAAGAEAVLGDPDVVGTLARSFEHVSVACVLLGSAAGSPAELAALHDTRLDMLLTRMVDTTLRGLVYEASGSVGAEVLARGAALVQERCEDARIPYVLLHGHPADARGWTSAAVAAVERALDGDPVGRR